MSEEDEVVNEDLTNLTAPEAEMEETPEEVVPEEATPAPGSKTDPALLLVALKEQREKTREKENRIKELEDKLLASTPDEDFEPSTEGLFLRKQIESLNAELFAMKGSAAKNDVLLAYPQLKDKWPEFEEYCQEPDNKGLSMRIAAKAFLVENGLFTARRKGLEKPTGGDKTPKPSGYTAEQIKDLRDNHYKKYMEMVKNGDIKISE